MVRHPQQQKKPIIILLYLSFTIWWSHDGGGGVASDPQTNLVTMGCSQANVTNVSVFRRNLNATYGKLRGEISNQSNHFATGQEVNGDSPAYALFQCRNYMSIPECLACFDFAVTQLRTNCTALANGAHVIFDGCFLRYESTSFFDQYTYPANNVVCGNAIKNSTEMASTVQQVLTNLDLATPRINGFFAATKTLVVPNGRNASNIIIFAFAQCVETLSPSGCQDCLKIALRNFQLCLPNSNAKTFDFGCFMRYSTTPFFPKNQTLVDINHFLKQDSNKKKAIIGGVVGGVSFILILLGLLVFHGKSKSSKKIHRGDILGATELRGPVKYKYKDLALATKNFSHENKLGGGGFGDVYKGTLRNGKVVAIKKMDFGQSKKVDEDFESEVKLISNVHHRNLVRLLGCCNKGHERLLIYEYMQNNVSQFLLGKMEGSQSWMKRYDIILGTARGLAYLHEEFHVCIVHRDVKASSVFLDGDFQPKIGNFGLVRLLRREDSHLTTEFAGTMAYTAPEYVMNGQISEKVDTYSFGVVLLEIISGQNNVHPTKNDSGCNFLLETAWKLYERGTHLEFVDKTLDPSEYDAIEVKKIIEIGLLCTQASPTARPKMSEIVRMLKRKDLMEHKRPRMPAFGEPIDCMMIPKSEPFIYNDSSSSNATFSTTIISGR